LTINQSLISAALLKKNCCYSSKARNITIKGWRSY